MIGSACGVAKVEELLRANMGYLYVIYYGEIT